MDQENRTMDVRADHVLHGPSVLHDKGRGALAFVGLRYDRRPTHGTLFVSHRWNELPLCDRRREVASEQGKFQFPRDATKSSCVQCSGCQDPVVDSTGRLRLDILYRRQAVQTPFLFLHTTRTKLCKLGNVKINKRLELKAPKI